MRALQQPGLRAVCIREVQKSLAQSAKRLIEMKIEAHDLGHLFEVQKAEIKTPGGYDHNAGRHVGPGLIIFQGMQNHTADSIKSLENFDIAWVEEAQTLSAKSLELLTPTIRKKTRMKDGTLRDSEIWFSWNPAHESDPVDDFLRGNGSKQKQKEWTPPPDARVVRANWMDNPWFGDTALPAEKDYVLGRDPDKYGHIWLGNYQRNSEARVFKNWKVAEFETPTDARFYFGADWGMRVDPSVLVRCYVVGHTLFVDQEAYQIGCPLDRRPAMFAKIPGSKNHPITADGSWPDTVTYMQQNGFPRMRPAVKGPGSVIEGVEFLQKYDIVVHPRCTHVIDELTHYAFEIDPHTLEVTNKLADKKNHTIDSLRYALENVRRAMTITREPLRL